MTKLVIARELQLDALASDEEDEKEPCIEAVSEWTSILRQHEKRRLRALKTLGNHYEWTKYLLQRKKKKQEATEEAIAASNSEDNGENGGKTDKVT